MVPFPISNWQRELAMAVRDPAELLHLLALPPQPALDWHSPFRLLVPHSYLARMRKGDWDDPLLRQVLPLRDERQAVPGFGHDPVGDTQAQQAAGVLHKYHGRVLLVTTGACAVHCRYCFRRHFPYAEATAAKGEWEAAIQYVRAHEEVREVILSGGDPLTLADARLSQLFSQLRDIPHVQRVRFHTRLPIVLPSRIDAGFLHLLAKLPLQKVMVIHANHANELAAPDVAAALAALRAAGVMLFNQAVLLRGVNDSVTAQVDLAEALFAHGVLPYYLHLLDKVAGAAHFDVPDSEAQHLLAQVRERLPGFLVPKLVCEVAGAGAKLPVC